ncbi:EAL domain-containing protein [Devosia rhodophyticola]|uniref:EAL domain-containing protein n=1 Tax=Devosia rhodophyticola TaxID=3026423 RepID=A0ABY7YXE2_9HYPH|nr:EAL domain-containing protein [Devosia rhodophyticola]WDR06029.1 EAL domain-containing protein [Devosia rhodophyticola]
MQRQIDRLRTEVVHAEQLTSALEALLCRDEVDPFSGVFKALEPIFGFSHAVVLVELGDVDCHLECVASQPAELIDSRWCAGRFFQKVLDGRAAVTFSNENLVEWLDVDLGTISKSQPALYLPMRVRDRRGLMMLLRPVGDAGFDRDHVALARKFALLASHAFAARDANQSVAESQRLLSLANKLQESQQALAHRANHDQLTELPNRTCMQELVEAAIKNRGDNGMIALAFVDLDNFKQVNDLYSHAVGDALLKSVAGRLRASIRKCDHVGRISGDEFLILFDTFDDVSDLQPIAARIESQMKRPFLVEGIEVVSSASMGIALYPEHGSDYEALRRNADIAMYRAKSAAKGTTAYFDDVMGMVAAARLEIEQQLRVAVRERQFRCVFQPKIDIRTMRVTGFEALARWTDCDGRVRNPSEFIEIAGELGLINDIATIIVADAIASFPALDNAFGSQTRISINVSARQASSPTFMTEFADRLAASGQSQRIILEVTEDAIVAAGPFQSLVLPQLRRMGTKVSIDDFGTGYSSLSALADITADEIKVDRSFILSIQDRPRSQSILKAIESLGNTLGMSVVAEGVETEDELNYLLDQTSIQTVQGYLFSRPLFVNELVKLAGTFLTSRGKVA